MIQREMSLSFVGENKTICGKDNDSRKSYCVKTTVPEKSSLSETPRWSNRVRPLRSSQKVSASETSHPDTETYHPSQENLKLLCETKNDIHFHFSDGAVIHAHKCVLSSASSYFANTFNETWDKDHPDGIWKTSDSSEVMTIVLTALYTGSIGKESIRKYPVSILSLAQKYEIASLTAVVEVALTRAIRVNNVKWMLICSEEYGLNSLKQGCFDFIKKNANAIFKEGDFMELESENGYLWSEMRTYLLQSY